MPIKEETQMLLSPTPATMPPSAPPETETQRLLAERAMSVERVAGYERELAAERKHLQNLERRLAKLGVAC